MLGISCFATDAEAQSAGTLKNFSEFEKVKGSFCPMPQKTLKTPDFRELHTFGSRTQFFSYYWSVTPIAHKQTSIPITKLAPDYIFSQWGIICLGEYRLQQKTGLPLRFRLGSLDYVNALEGK